MEKKSLPGGESNPVFRVTGRDTHYYTTEDPRYIKEQILLQTLLDCHDINSMM